MGLFKPPDVQRLKARRDSDALLRALRHDLSSIRQEAAEALGELGVGAAVPTLCDLIEHDEIRNVRWTAAKALGAIGDAAATTALRSALHDSDLFVKQFAAQALVALDGTEPIRAVIGALESDDTEVATIAHKGLPAMASRSARVGGEATAVLLDALGTTRGTVRSGVARALAAIPWDMDTGTEEQRFHYAVGLRRWDLWEPLARTQVDLVCHELAGRDDVAFPHACRVLGDLGGPRAVDALAGALRALPFGLSRHPADGLEQAGWAPSNPRDEVLFLLARLKPGDRPPALLSLGAAAFDGLAYALPHAPEMISVVLAALGDSRAVPLLVREIDRADGAGNSCLSIIESLARLGGAEAREAIERVGRQGHLQENRLAAQSALRDERQPPT